MSNWTPTVGEKAAIIASTDAVQEVTIERITKTKIVTTGGDFRIGRRGYWLDSFGPYAKADNPWARKSSLVQADSPTLAEVRRKLREGEVLNQAIDAGHRFANGVRFAKDKRAFIAATIVELEAIRHALERGQS